MHTQFQNRRCRRGKGQRTPAPQTFAEMTARLGAALPAAECAAAAPEEDSCTAESGATPPPSPPCEGERRNALEPGRTAGAGVFPAAYEPSPIGTDPFVMAHEAWLRDPRDGRAQGRARAAPTMEDVLDGLHAMEVDDVEAPAVRRAKPLPRRRAAPRTVSSGSGSGSGSSGGVSRSSSFSTAPSSVLSSPRGGEAAVLAPGECAWEGGSARADEGWEGALDAASKVRVDAWMTELPEGEPGSKWEQLLAAVSVAPPVQGA